MLGIAAGLLIGPAAGGIKWIGDIFIAAIKMLVVPLIFFSLTGGVVSIGDIRKLGGVGARTFLIFIPTALFSVALGIILGLVVRPGEGLVITGITPPEPPVPLSVTDMIVSMVPQNPIGAMAETQVLQIIVFALLFGIGILMAREAGGPIARGIDSGAAVMQKLTVLVMELAPLGVFALMAWVAGTYGLAALLPLAKLVVTLYAGCAILIFGVYAFTVRVLGRLPLRAFYRGILDAQAIAYSTASSNAALPVTLRCMERNLGVRPGVASFVVSLGATINMDGTALYLGLATVFGAQIFGVQLDMGDYLSVMLTATLGSMGAAGIPGAGLIMMTLVFSQVGVPLETIAFVAGVDRIMDMARTATNVTGDCSTCATVASWTGEIDTREYGSADDV